MKVVIGITSLSEAEYFLKHGASEVYFGYGAISNHRASESVLDEREALEIVRLAHSLGSRAFITVNEIYDSHTLLEAAPFLCRLVKHGVGGFIVRDAAMLYVLDRLGVRTKFVVSHMGFTFNSATVDYYRRLGVSRVVWPQHLRPFESAAIIRKTGSIETEIFFSPRFYCINTEGACMLLYSDRYTQSAKRKHAMPKMFCHNDFRAGGRPFVMPEPSSETKLGDLYDFDSQGMEYLKVGRLLYMGGMTQHTDVFTEAMTIVRLLDKKMPRAKFVKEALAATSELEEPWKKHYH